ncbi:MAG: copper oxidase [Chloroflexi bacterium]|nr:copper oxidase [Chloroflexota bacterium]
MFASFLALVVIATFVSRISHSPAPAAAAGTAYRVQFVLNDDPASWFRNTSQPPVAGTQSLAVVNPGARIDFGTDSNTVHTVTSLVFPTGAAGMPFDQPKAFNGSVSTPVVTPGLYVFTCKVHPYMFGAVIADDPATQGLDLGESISLLNGITVPTSSDLATRLLRTFFIATNPSNWQDYNPATNPSGVWHITYPNVDVRITGGAVVNLPSVLNARYGNDTALATVSDPATPGVGQVWVDTQFELTSGKSKPGTATAVEAATWQVSRKVALPQINMNNPHNMWTDRDQRLIFQTQWFDSRLTVFERETGRLVDDIAVGPAPAHAMTRVDTDEVHVTLNGSDAIASVVELSPRAGRIERKIDIGRAFPHAHWMSHDGKKMVTPNAFSADSTLHDFPTASNRIQATGAHPLATGMMPDSSKYYVANFLDSTLTCISIDAPACKQGGSAVDVKQINLLAAYDPIGGAITGPAGALPIQTPVSPNGKNMVTANTLTATMTIVDPATDALVNMLPCDPGCHGVQYGAKQGGGYYAYVSSKFSNTMLVVDPDPNGDGNASDAAIAGRVLLVALDSTASDAVITGNAGMGGQGVLAVPVVYNGWVQNLPKEWKELLTREQQDPVP